MAEMIDSWTDEDLAALWKCGGFEDALSKTRPGKRHPLLCGAARALADDALPPRVRRNLLALVMLRGMTRAARRELARLFASLAPHEWVPAVVALLCYLVAAGTSLPPQAPTPVRRMTSQVGRGVLAPVRGSPLPAVHMCPVMPGAPPT